MLNCIYYVQFFKGKFQLRCSNVIINIEIRRDLCKKAPESIIESDEKSPDGGLMDTFTKKKKISLVLQQLSIYKVEEL